MLLHSLISFFSFQHCCHQNRLLMPLHFNFNLDAFISIRISSTSQALHNQDVSTGSHFMHVVSHNAMAQIDRIKCLWCLSEFRLRMNSCGDVFSVFPSDRY